MYRQSPRPAPIWAAALALLLLPVLAAAQHADPADGDPGTEAHGDLSLPLYDNLGLLTREVTTWNATAQAYFDQGLRLAYGFGHGEAVRSFRVAGRSSDDLEVLTLLGEGHMVLRPWNYRTEEGEPEPGVERAAKVLERALERDLSHPGACHLYIHLVEASPQPKQAEPCADLLADMIPGVSHIPHMPSHVYMRIGRYGEAAEVKAAFQEAWQRADVWIAGARF